MIGIGFLVAKGLHVTTMIGSNVDFYNHLVLQQANTNIKTAAVFHHPMRQHGALLDISNQTPSKINARKKALTSPMTTPLCRPDEKRSQMGSTPHFYIHSDEDGIENQNPNCAMPISIKACHLMIESPKKNPPLQDSLSPQKIPQRRPTQEYQETMNLQKTLDKLTERLKQVSPLNEEDVEVEEALSNLVFAYLECNTSKDDNIVTIRPKNGRQRITRSYLKLPATLQKGTCNPHSSPNSQATVIRG